MSIHQQSWRSIITAVNVIVRLLTEHDPWPSSNTFWCKNMVGKSCQKGYYSSTFWKAYKLNNQYYKLATIQHFLLIHDSVSGLTESQTFQGERPAGFQMNISMKNKLNITKCLPIVYFLRNDFSTSIGNLKRLMKNALITRGCYICK